MKQPVSLCLLGRQPHLGLAELENLYGANNVALFGESALLQVPYEVVEFNKLGGSTRLCKVLAPLKGDWSAVKDYLLRALPEQASRLPEGKITVGLSIVGFSVHLKEVERTLLTIKKLIKNTGRPVRVVPNKQLELNTAQVIHNNLTVAGNIEFVVVGSSSAAYVAQTMAVQDIEAYASRDQARPMRDAKVGMLPPKLAQIIVNLASAKDSTSSTRPVAEGQPTAMGEPLGSPLKRVFAEDVKSSKTVGRNTRKKLILDPFCGTGVVLQEATLMGYDVYGTDLEPRMVEYSIANLHWLREKFDVAGEYVRIEQGDATTHTWQSQIDLVACETYLGQPYATPPPKELLLKNIRYVDGLHRKFLRNIHKQLASGTRLCLAVPAWHTGKSIFHLPVLDHLQELGYNRVKFIHATNDQLVYHRANQVVGRELIVVVKI